MSMNEITLKGKIVHIDQEIKHHVLQILVEVVRSSGIVDTLPVHLPVQLKHFIEENKFYLLTGMIRTTNVYDQEKNIKHVCVYAYVKDVEEITEEESLVENNTFLAEGVICKKFEKRVTGYSNRVVMNATLATYRENSCYKNRIDYVPILLWSINANYIDGLPDYVKVDLTGRLQSRTYYSKRQQCNGVAYEVSVSSIYAILDEDEEDNKE